MQTLFECVIVIVIQMGRFPSRRARIPPATERVVLAALRRGRLPWLQELQPGASERHSCPLRPRWLLRRFDIEQSMAAPNGHRAQ